MTDKQNSEGLRTSAKVYQFPLRGRLLEQARELEAPRYSVSAAGEGWYHEAAIAEEREKH